MGGSRVAAVGAAVGVVVLFVLGGQAHAQGTARSLDLDTSVRALGRGGATNAVYQDGGNEWANPALLGYRNGLSFSWDRQALVPELADDVVLSSRRVSLGLWGLGFSTAGQPVDVLGGTDLDYGRSEIVDPNGNPIGAYDSFEHIRAWSLGASLASVVDNAAAALGRRHGLADWGDLAVGVSRKRVVMALYPPETYTANATDWGLLARVSPIDTRRGAGAAAGATHRLDVSFGHSVLNSNDVTIEFPFYGPVAASRTRRDGGAVGWTMRASPDAARADRWLRRALGRDLALVRVVLAMDHEHVGRGDDEGYGYGVDRWGGEAAFGRVFALRLGHVEDHTAGIDGFSWGAGVGAPVGPLAELAYDFASIPQASGMDHRHAHSVTLRLDVLETLRKWREEGARAD